MEGWKKDNIQKIFNLGRGRVISQTEVENTLGVYPVYSSQSQNNGEMGRINTYDFNGDYVTWTTDGAYAGTVFFRTGKFNCTNVCGTLKAIDEDNIDHQFFAYLFSVVSKKYVSYVGNPKLMNGIVAKIQLFYPKLVDEQRKIAEILSTVDRAIEQTEQLIAKYRHIKQGLMHDLLTYGIDANGNIRTPKTHKFEIKNGLLVPSDWKVVCVEDILELLTDYDANGSFEDMKNNVLTYDSENYAWFVRATDLENKTPLNQVKYVDENSYNFLRKSYLEGGEVLIAKRGEIGKVYKMPMVQIKATLAPNMYLLRLNNKVFSDFVYYYFISNRGRKSLVDSNASTTLGALYKDTVKALAFTLPGKDEQNRITKTLIKHDKLIEKEEENLTKYKKIKQGLMHDLLTPTKRVKL